MGDFYLTKMGQQFFLGTVPQLVKAVTALNENVSRLADAMSASKGGQEHMCREHDQTPLESKRFAILRINPEDNQVDIIERAETAEEANGIMMRELGKIAKRFGTDLNDRRVSYCDLAAEFRDGDYEELLHIIDE